MNQGWGSTVIHRSDVLTAAKSAVITYISMLYIDFHVLTAAKSVAYCLRILVVWLSHESKGGGVKCVLAMNFKVI